MTESSIQSSNSSSRRNSVEIPPKTRYKQKTKRNTLWKYHTLTLSITKLQQVNKIVI